MKRTLLGYQSRWVRDKTPLKVYEKARRTGVSWCTAYDAVMHAGEGLGNVYYQSFDKEMTRGFITDCEDWGRHLNMVVSSVDEVLLDDEGGEDKVQAFRILIGGKEILAMTSAPRQFRSKGRPGDMGLIDEAAFIENLAEVLKAALAFTIWGGRIQVISTHNGETNPFAKLVDDIRTGKQPGSLHTTTFNEALEDGLAERVLETIGREVTQENIDGWVDMIRHIYRNNAAEELDCIPSPGSGSWLTWEMIRGCQHRDAGIPELYMGGSCFIGIDVARRKHLWVATVLESVLDIRWTREMVVLQNARFSEQRKTVRDLTRRYRVVRIAVDQTGIGENFTEDLQEEFGTTRVEGVLMTPARRLAVATSLKEAHEDRLIRTPNDEATENDLHSVKREAGPTGAPRLVAVENEDGHADRFWSMALAEAAASGGGVVYGYQPAHVSADDERQAGPPWLRRGHEDGPPAHVDRFTLMGRHDFRRGVGW